MTSAPPRRSPRRAPASQPDSRAVPRVVVGQRVIDRVRTTLIDQALPERHIVDLLGVSQSYWHSLTNGHRSIQALSKEKMQRLADFLDLPLIQVCVLADQFVAEDFVRARGLDDELRRIADELRADARWLAMAPTPKQWAALPLQVRILVSALYEECRGKLARQLSEAGP